MVLVPFGKGNKPRMAVVLRVEEQQTEEIPERLKEIFDAAPEQARLTPDLLELVHFLKARTFCTWFEAVKAVIPYGAQYRAAVVDGKPVMQNRLSRSTERLYTLVGELPSKPKPGPRQKSSGGGTTRRTAHCPPAGRGGHTLDRVLYPVCQRGSNRIRAG